MEQVFTGSPDRLAIMATTALESTPPDKNAPSGTLGDHADAHGLAQALDQFARTSAGRVVARRQIPELSRAA